jgi:hypothetical protein
MSVGQLEISMTSREVGEWQAYFRLEQLDYEQKPYPWTDEEIWGFDREAEDRSRQIDENIFGFL